MVLYVTIDDAALQHLRELAKQERRRPRDQAAILLENALRGAPRETNHEPCGQLAATSASA